METKITSQTETEAQFDVALDETHLKEIKSEVFDGLRRRVKASGFRPGKAPDMIVERELGSATVQSEFLDHAIEHTYVKAVRELKLSTISSPKITLGKFVPYTQLEYKVTVELMPKVTLADYKALKGQR